MPVTATTGSRRHPVVGRRRDRRTPRCEGGTPPPATRMITPPLPGPRRLTSPPASRNRTAQFAWGAVVVLLMGVIGLVDLRPHRSAGDPAGGTADRRRAGRGHPAGQGSALGLRCRRRRRRRHCTDGPHRPAGPAPPAAGRETRGALRGGRVLPILCSGAVAIDRGPVPLRALHRPEEHAVGPAVGLPRHQTVQLRGIPLRQPLPGLHRRRAVLGRHSTPMGRSPASPPSPRPQAAAGLPLRHRPSTGSTAGSYPFVDVGNRLVTSTSAFSPAVLAKQSQAAIAAGLGQAERPHRRRPSWPQPTS